MNPLSTQATGVPVGLVIGYTCQDILSIGDLFIPMQSIVPAFATKGAAFVYGKQDGAVGKDMRLRSENLVVCFVLSRDLCLWKNSPLF